MNATRLLLFCALVFPLGAPAQTALPSVQEVYKIFQNKCTACHDNSGPAGGLDLVGAGATEFARAVNVAQKLVNINPTNTYAQAQGHKRVYPGRPDRSFLFRKINSGFEPTIAALHANEGNPMPEYPSAGLTELEKEIIRQWILYGAKTSGVLFNKSVVENFYNTGGDKSFPDGPPPAPPASEGFQIKMGPFYLAPDGEVEYYQKYELKLPADVEVDRLEFKLSNYSHHFLLYDFDAPADANAIPAGLRLNSFHNNIGLVAAVQEATDLELPAGTAFRWDDNLVLDLNSHYINYSLSKPYQCEVYVNVYTKPVGTAEQEMFASLIVNPAIPIPNNGNMITHGQNVFEPGADSIYIWGLMGHTHKYGKGYKVWKRLPNGQKGELIYDASCPMGIPGCPSPYFDYQHIPLRYWLPLLPIKWSNGIIHEAQWVNDGPASVSFGPTSDDEMMVLIAFYTQQPISTAAAAPTGAETALVWPNPTDGRVTVRTPGARGIRQVRVFDLSGRVVRTLQDLPGEQFELDLTGLPRGVYYFHADRWTGKVILD